MTKKDYILIASVIRETVATRGVHQDTTEYVIYLAHHMAAKLRIDNSQFNCDKFLQECGVAP